MAKKAAKAQDAAPAQSSVNVGGDLAGLMDSAGVSAEPAKQAKSSVAELKLADKHKDISAKIRLYIKYSAKEKAAEARKKGIGDDIRPVVKAEYTIFCREQNIYHKTICINGDMNFGSIQLKVAQPDAKAGTTQGSIKQGLKDHFGADDYAKYVEDTITIFVKPELTNAATIKLLQDKLGMDDFKRVFGYEQNIGLKEIGGDKDKIVVLKRDSILSPTVAAKVEEAIGKNLLAENMGTLNPQKSAISVAEEEHLAMEQQFEQFLASQKPAVAAK